MNKIFVYLTVCVLFIVYFFPVEGYSVQKLTSPVSNGQDKWPMFRHDAAHTGFSSSQAPCTSTVLWEKMVDDPKRSSPVTSNGNVYVSSYEGKVYCLNGENGTTIWESQILDTQLDCDPCVSNGHVFVSCQQLFCLNAFTGEVEWNTSFGANGRAPTIVDDKVYIGARNLSCLYGSNGTVLWSVSTGSSQFFTSPAVSNGKVYVCDGQARKLYCVNAFDGGLLWNVTITNGISVTPAVMDGRVYVGTWGGAILCYNGDTGGYLWGNSIYDQIHSSFAIGYGNVYFGSYDNNVYCFNAINGGFLWSAPTGSFITSSPLLADGKVYISSDNFYCFNAMNGSLLWEYSTGGGISSPAVTNGRIYVASNTGKVFCFKDPEYPPDVPSTPVGPTHAGAYLDHNYSTSTIDPEGDSIYYQWDFGEDNLSEWLGPYSSGEQITVNHTWINESQYDIRVKAKDTSGAESNWSEPLTVYIEPQISVENILAGDIYFRFTSINGSILHSDILRFLGFTIVFSDQDLFFVINASDSVQSISIVWLKPITGLSLTYEDTNSSDGFNTTFAIPTGLYQFTILAYDGNGTLLDVNFLPTLLNLHLKQNNRASLAHHYIRRS